MYHFAKKETMVLREYFLRSINQMTIDARSAVPQNVRAGRDVSGFPNHCIFKLGILRPRE